MTETLHLADPRLLDAAIRAGDADYDRAWELLLSAAPYNPIHTRIVSGRAHRIRESLAYAFALLERGEETVEGEPRSARGARVLDAVLALQDTDPDSPTCGIWAYWAEEPLTAMNPPDWNWADFLGEYLSLVLFRHGDRLDPALRGRVEIALGHAARSIIRRSVDLDYTNIAVKGTFVALAAGELLGDEGIAAWGLDRLQGLRDHQIGIGSFAEFNSPTYWHVVLQALTGIRQYVAAPDAAAPVADLERLAWEHFLRHWHPGTGQLSGPMARCYSTDLHGTPGVLAVLQAVAGDTWPLLDGVAVPADVHLVQDAVLDYRIPADLRPLLDREESSDTVRETFAETHYIPGQVAGISASAAAGIESVVVPTVGATWRSGGATLGSVNLIDTWLQRRALLGYWAEPGDDPSDISRPARSVSLEVIRDGHGFSGGAFRSVQEGGTVLWAVGLATPSGDAHIHLDTIPAGAAIPTEELLVRFRITGADAAAIRVDGDPFAGQVEGARRVQIDTAGIHLDWMLGAAAFDGEALGALVRIEDQALLIEIPWIARSAAADLSIADLGPTYAAGMLRVSVDELPDAGLRAASDDEVVRLSADALALTASARPGSRLDHARIALRDQS